MGKVGAQRERGQTLVEFALILALVAVICVASLILFGATVTNLISTLASTVQSNV
jgi:Flp pilus assembly pilin Flp